MLTITPIQILTVFSITFFITGFLCLFLGIYILVRRAHSSDIDAIAGQAGRVVQKSFGGEINTLINNSASLITALNSMVNTRAGIGQFLCVIGLIQLGLSLMLVYWMQTL